MLNDQTISIVCSLMRKDDKDIHVFDEGLMTRMMQLDEREPRRRQTFRYEALNVQRRERRRHDIFALKKLFFPVSCRAGSDDHFDREKRNHWTLVVVDMEARTIRYYDSMGADGELWIQGVEAFLRREWAMLNPEEADEMPSFTCIKGSKATPQQGYVSNDCGVFMLITIDLLRKGLPLDFNQAQVEQAQYRHRIAASIIKDTLFLDGQAALEQANTESEGQQQEGPQENRTVQTA